MRQKKWMQGRKRYAGVWIIVILLAAGIPGVPGKGIWDHGAGKVLAEEGVGSFSVTGFVQDDAGFLTREEENNLEAECAGIMKRHDTAAYIVTTPDFGAGDIKDWQREVFAGSGMGAESSGSAVMLAVSMAGRDWGLVGFGTAQEVFSVYGRELIGERILGDLSDGGYYDAFFEYLSMADDYLTAAEKGKPYTKEHPYGQGWRIPAIIGVSFLLSFAVSLGIVMSWKKSMNTRVRQEGAMEYMKDGSFRLYNRTDQFLYHTVSRKKRPETTQSGGGGGSRTHSDRSGTSGKF